LRRSPQGAVAGNRGVRDGERAAAGEDSAALPLTTAGALGGVAGDRIVVELEIAAFEEDRAALSVRTGGDVAAQGRVGEPDRTAGDVEAAPLGRGGRGTELRHVA